jgi:hypothetical protein
MTRRQWIGADHGHVVAARRLAPHDLPGTVDVACIVDPFALVADSDLAAPPVMTPRPSGLSGDRLG